MTISVKHKFQSAKSDGTDATVVQPSAWNDDHTLSCASDKVIGRVTGGTGPVEEIPCTSTGRQLLAAASTSAVASLLGVSSLPPGVIAPFAGVSPPSGWLLCDGSAVSRTTYATLFSAIGSTWGAGNGSSTFNLPNLQGAFLRGAGGGLNPSNRNVGSYQADSFASHTHAASQDPHNHTVASGSAIIG